MGFRKFRVPFWGSQNQDYRVLGCYWGLFLGSEHTFRAVSGFRLPKSPSRRPRILDAAVGIAMWIRLAASGAYSVSGFAFAFLQDLGFMAWDHNTGYYLNRSICVYDSLIWAVSIIGSGGGL